MKSDVSPVETNVDETDFSNVTSQHPDSSHCCSVHYLESFSPHHQLCRNSFLCLCHPSSIDHDMSYRTGPLMPQYAQRLASAIVMCDVTRKVTMFEGAKEWKNLWTNQYTYQTANPSLMCS